MCCPFLLRQRVSASCGSRWCRRGRRGPTPSAGCPPCPPSPCSPRSPGSPCSPYSPCSPCSPGSPAPRCRPRPRRSRRRRRCPPRAATSATPPRDLAMTPSSRRASPSCTDRAAPRDVTTSSILPEAVACHHRSTLIQFKDLRHPALFDCAVTHGDTHTNACENFFELKDLYSTLPSNCSRFISSWDNICLHAKSKAE